MPRYVAYQKIKEQYDISPQTIKNWAKRGAINYKSIQNATRKTWLYDIDSIGKYIDSTTEIKKTETTVNEVTVCYCRVSSKKQEPDLIRQIELLSKVYPGTEIIKDIGSGLNFKRPGFSKLVDRVCRGDVSRIVVTYKDRLMRFGNDLFKQICKANNVQIVVYSKEHALQDVAEEDEGTRELQEDLLSIVNIFVARRNGKRSGQFRKERTRLEEESKRTNENQDISDDSSEE